MKTIDFTTKEICENLSISRKKFNEMLEKDMVDSLVNKVSTFFSTELLVNKNRNVNTLEKIDNLVSQIGLSSDNGEYYERIDSNFVAVAKVNALAVYFSVIEVEMTLE